MSIPMATPALPDVFNFAHHVLELNRHRHDKLAYIDDWRRMSYGELDDETRRFAAALLALDIRPEERILLSMADTTEMPVALLGALLAGIVPVPINPLLPMDDILYMIDHCQARAVVTSSLMSENVAEAIQRAHEHAHHTHGHAPKMPHIIVSDHLKPQARGGLPFARLLQTGPLPQNAWARTHADQFAFWLYSSGSTGRPKGTVHSHANLYWTAALYARPVLGIEETDIVFSAAKLFFAYGLGNGFTFPLSVGATTILMAERPTPHAVFDRLVKHRPTIFYGVPTLYAGMLASPELPAAEAVALRLCTSAGEALPESVGKRFTEHFHCEILDGIGSTEMLHIFISNRPGEVRYGSSGKPVPGYEIEIRDEHGQPAAVGDIGDLYIQGPSAALLYWTNRDKTRTTFQGHWVKSGDKYVVDTDGYYTYSGRSDDMLKVSGQYVSPIEVESALMDHSAVLECAVIGTIDGQGLTRTHAYIVLMPGQHEQHDQQALDAELKKFVKGKLAPHKYPREITFVSELPKTATGKIQRFKLRALHQTD